MNLSKKLWLFSWLLYYNAFFKDRILFKQAQASIEVDVSVVKKTCVFLKFVEKYVRSKWKKKDNVIIIIITEYAWCLNMPK